MFLFIYLFIGGASFVSPRSENLLYAPHASECQGYISGIPPTFPARSLELVEIPVVGGPVILFFFS